MSKILTPKNYGIMEKLFLRVEFFHNFKMPIMNVNDYSALIFTN